MKQKSNNFGLQAMDKFLISSGCWQVLISGYLDSNWVECNIIELARCNRYSERAQG